MLNRIAGNGGNDDDTFKVPLFFKNKITPSTRNLKNFKIVLP